MTSRERRAAQREYTRNALHELNRNAAGLLFVASIMRSEISLMLLEAQAGNRDAAMMRGAVNALLIGAAYAGDSDPARCGGCRRPIRRGDQDLNFAMISGREPEAPPSMGVVVCTACGPTPDAVLDVAIAALRTVWPDVRHITVTHPDGGHA